MATVADFEELYKTYATLAETLAKAFETTGDEAQRPAEAVLAERECLSKIEQMNGRVLQLSAEWEKYGPLEDPANRERARHFIAAAKAVALRLKRICDAHAEKVTSVRARILNDLTNIGKGSRLLHSLRPVKTNYPKFIDSSF